VTTRSGRIVRFVETWIRVGVERPLDRPLNAPSPRKAHQRRSWAGLDDMPRAISPSHSKAIKVPQVGRPAAKNLVKSIPSMIHRRPVVPERSPTSSPRKPSPGRASRMAASTASSVATSASVTGLPSTFAVEATPSGLHHRRVTSSATSAKRNASSRSGSTARQCPRPHRPGGRCDRPPAQRSWAVRARAPSRPASRSLDGWSRWVKGRRGEEVPPPGAGSRGSVGTSSPCP
jgi:hypothetical protein